MFKLPPPLPKPVKLADVPRLLQSAETLIDDLNVRVQAVLDRFEEAVERMERVPEGEIFPMEKTVSGDRVTHIKLDEEPDTGYKPWFSCTVYNDGDDDLYIAVNSPNRKFLKVMQGESMEIDMHAPKIRVLYLKTVIGGSCNLRIVGER